MTFYGSYQFHDDNVSFDARAGLGVDEELLNDLIAVQTTVRQHFGWDYQDDFTSAKCMGDMMNSPTPFEVEVWSPDRRIEALSSLKQVLLSAKNVTVVGASVCKSDIDKMISDDSVIIAADGSVGAVIDLPNLVCVVTDFDGNPHLNALLTQILYLLLMHTGIILNGGNNHSMNGVVWKIRQV